MEGIGDGILTAIIFIGVLAFLIGGAVSWMFSSGDTYETTQRLKPIRYELVIDNNQVDTLWVYELK